MLSPDPNQSCYRFDVRIHKVGDKVAAYCAPLPAAAALATAEKDVLNAVCRQVSIAIKECRNQGWQIPWSLPSPQHEFEATRSVQINMLTRQEEMCRDRELSERLRAWAKRGRKNSLKQQRKVAIRLHALGFAAEAQAVLRHSWEKWADPAMIAEHMDADDIVTTTGEFNREKFARRTKLKNQSRLCAAFASGTGDHPVALMREWWKRLQERMNAEYWYSVPNVVDESDRQSWEQKQRQDLRDCRKIYHGSEDEVRQRVAVLLEKDQQDAERDAEESKERVARAARSERDGAVMREIAEDLKIAEVMTKIEERKNDATSHHPS